jgi:hypothetical protein
MRRSAYEGAHRIRRIADPTGLIGLVARAVTIAGDLITRRRNEKAAPNIVITTP